MLNSRLVISTLAPSFGVLLVAFACSSEPTSQSEHASEKVTGKAIAGCMAPEVSCPPDKNGNIDVMFSADQLSVSIASCKDLSNVVLEFSDGTQQKFDDLSGTSAV